MENWKLNLRIPVIVLVERHDSNILYIRYGLHFIIIENNVLLLINLISNI